MKNFANTLYPRGAVYYIDLGKADGTSKQAGIRPCILVSSDINNRHSSNVNIVCLTNARHRKKPLSVHYFISAKESGLEKDSICLCEQTFTVSKSELLDYVTTLSPEIMKKISECLRIQFSL